MKPALGEPVSYGGFDPRGGESKSGRTRLTTVDSLLRFSFLCLLSRAKFSQVFTLNLLSLGLEQSVECTSWEYCQQRYVHTNF